MVKTIATLKGPEFLRACNRVRYAVEKFAKETNVMDLRKVMPVITEDMDDEQRMDAIREQSKKNISAMLDRVLEEKPEATYDLLCALMANDTGEELDGVDLITAAMEILSNKKVLDFLLQLARSVQTDTAE